MAIQRPWAPFGNKFFVWNFGYDTNSQPSCATRRKEEKPSRLPAKFRAATTAAAEAFQGHAPEAVEDAGRPQAPREGRRRRSKP
jgi:hypothetical protein